MLLSITTTHQPEDDLGYLLHKRPDRFQSFDLRFGKAHFFYPEASADRCTACLMLDVDPVGLVRDRRSVRDWAAAHGRAGRTFSVECGRYRPILVR